MQNKISTFTDLIAWQEGHKLVLITYDMIQHFPLYERFGLTDQMRRCAISVTSNVAEGFSRNTPRDKNQFYYVALGSITELQNQLIIAKDRKYISADNFQKIINQSILVHKLINGLIKSNKKKYNEESRK